MKYEISRTTQFEKDYKLAKKRGLDTDELKAIIVKLADGIELEEKYRDHELGGTGNQ